MRALASGRLLGVRILLVDDDDVARRVALMALATEEASVTPVGTVASALAFACFLHPDVIVVDLSMEEEGGWRLLEALRKRETDAGIPIVATSRCADDAEPALLGGFAGFVAKPFDTETLRATVARVAIDAAMSDPRA